SHAPDAVVASARRAAAALRVDDLGAYRVHWPVGDTHEPFAPPGARNPASRPYIHGEFMATWRAMESLVDSGIVRHIGVSNVTIPKLELILRDARIAPAINEMELHPCFQQPELFRYCVDRGLAVVAYCPIGSPARPERDRAPEDRADTEHPVVARIARAHGIHPAEACLKWAAQRGQVPIPFSLDPAHQAANLRAVESDPLTPAEMEDMKAADCGNRLIKGQVFLWEGSSDWRDLWDVDGTIPTWGDAARRAGPPA
ncbi:MAG: aldo/keto reductase, partial [Bifidobacteriaceae bacterium]|nr:aldo/keto reductase [Bifidobacteriaceae bacterium]